MATNLALAFGTIFAQDFRVLEPLGKGGMGAVYVAEQLTTGKRRALKIMHPQIANDERSRERFVQEARIGSLIESDHVVEVVSAGIDAASGTPWIAMELLRGETLAAAVERRGGLPLDEAREVLAQLAHALGAAHAAGIVHRDLKPENVFLAAPRRQGVPFTVKVLDFGIAKLLVESTRGAPTASMGTPLWMAPEQMEESTTISPAADVWSLGLIAFHLLTARPYWLSANGPTPSPIAVLREVIQDPIVPPSVRATQLGRGDRIPPGFDAWFARCVARSANDRFREAREARAALEVALAGAAPRATSAPTTAHAPVERPRRSRAFVFVALAGGAIVVAAIVVLTQIDLRGESAPKSPAPTKTSAPSSDDDDEPAPKKKHENGPPPTSSPSQVAVTTLVPGPISDEKCSYQGKTDTCEVMCDRGDKVSCTELASTYWEDPVRRSSARRRGCDLGDATACFVLAEYTRLGVGVPIDAQKAKALYAKACGLGLEKACASK